MSITTKKIQIYPIGDKNEIDRVFKYIRDGMYNQYRMLNTYMSQMGCLYYKYNKEISNSDYKEEVKEIFRNTNSAIHDIEQAKGLGMSGSCGMRVKQDFSTALKNGFARGERNLPFYKRDFPLLVQARFLNFYTTTEKFINDENEEQERDIFAIKFVNGIHFKVILGSRGKRDLYLLSLLDSIINDSDNYHVCGSSIQFDKKNHLILNLTIKINKDIVEYEPVPDRVMGLAMGYDKCLTAALSNNEEVYSIGDNYKDNIIEKRIQIQQYRENLQKALKNAQGGHGRKRKLRALDNDKKYEKNVVRHFNHVLSKEVIEFAKKHKVSTIIMEDISKEDLRNYPVLLRNWSYYQLQTFITYKAGKDIEVRLATSNNTVEEDKKKNNNKKDKFSKYVCCKCGCKLEKDNILPDNIVWCNEISFVCPNCNEQIDYSYNKAKLMTVLG